MRRFALVMLTIPAIMQATELQVASSQDSVAQDGLAVLLSRGGAEPGMMVVLAAATIVLQFVRKYRADRSSRTRVFQRIVPQAIIPTTTEG
jgi:hypothetical protein